MVAAVGLEPDHGHQHSVCAGPLLDLACKIFCTNNAAVSLMDATAMYVLEGRGMVAGGARLEDAWAAGSFCCWSTVSSMPSVLAVEDALLDVRQGPCSLAALCRDTIHSVNLTEASV